jgi:hypothetical protein
LPRALLGLYKEVETQGREREISIHHHATIAAASKVFTNTTPTKEKGLGS